jgi:hypothetical protein
MCTENKVEFGKNKIHFTDVENNEDIFQFKQVWLKFYGYNDSDVLTDEYGYEYVLTIDESGNPTEPCYQVRKCRIYLRI